MLNIEISTLNDFKTNLYQCLANASNLLAAPFNNLWNTPITVFEPEAIANNIQLRSQAITYL